MTRTMIVVLTLGLAASCSDSERPPIDPGGGGGAGGGGGGEPDASVEADAAVTGITGTMCPITDFRFPTACDVEQSPANIDVIEQISGNSTVSDSGGSYSVQTAGGSSATLLVASGDLARRNSLLPVALDDGSASGVVAPVMLASDYDQLQLVLGVVEPDDTASIALYVRSSSGAPVAGVNVVEPAGTTDVLYDSVDQVFDPNGPTQSFGTVVMFGVPPESGLVDFTVVRPDQTVINVQDVPAVAGTTTFLTVRI